MPVVRVLSPHDHLARLMAEHLSTRGLDASPAPAPGETHLVLRVRAALQGVMETRSGDTVQEADLIAGAIDLTVTCARVIIADAASLAADVTILLRKWIVEPDALATALARSDWLLDGWDRSAALWETAPPHQGVEVTLGDMSNLVPALPREIGTWVGHQLNIDADLQRHRRKVVLLEDWRTGRCVVDLIGRNEAVLEHAG